MNRKLPLGIQDFTGIREDGYVYVDKTEHIYRLVTSAGKVFFLSRPRRFGKSLLCSTLSALFSGRRELFRGISGRPGLCIDTLDWDWKAYPIIKLDLNPGDYSQGYNVLVSSLANLLENTAGIYGLRVRGDTVSDQFTNLIMDLAKTSHERVVIIVDEYDKPLLSTIDNEELHGKMRNVLKGFYSVFKSSDEYLKFVFLTGVTRFSRVSIFSDLNNLIDISLNPDYADLCGITQEELATNFEPEIDEIVKTKGHIKKEYLDELKRFYNGYRFSKKEQTVYNPFGLLNHFFNKGDFESYWFVTGTPAFLIKLIENQHIDILNLENGKVALNDFQKFDMENMDAVSVLYQSGYLTITGYAEKYNEYSLDYPNEEVRASFAKSLLDYYIKPSYTADAPLALAIPKALDKGDIDSAMNALIPFFASIPYDIQIKQERYYQTVVHLIFRMLGLYCLSEVKIATGRIDTLVETNRYVYCFEFKLDGTAEEALRQIDDKNYLLPWKGRGKKLFKIGVSFDYEKRNIGEWKVSALP
jgi:hypothetical protein